MPLAKLYPDKKQYTKVRLAMVDLGLIGGQLRAERLEKQRRRGRALYRRIALERRALEAQRMNAVFDAAITLTAICQTPSLTLASSEAS